jgi:hypothetical protein
MKLINTPFIEDEPEFLVIDEFAGFGDIIKANTFYKLVDGQFVEA